MKAYRVVFEANAQKDAIEAADYIALSSAERALEWFSRLQKAIASLCAMPSRCGLARESGTSEIILRQYIYHSHRIIFQIEEDEPVVRILHIGHAARRPMPEVED